MVVPFMAQTMVGEYKSQKVRHDVLLFNVIDVQADYYMDVSEKSGTPKWMVF